MKNIKTVETLKAVLNKETGDRARDGWNIIDTSSDNGDIVAIVDPDDILTELGYSTEHIAKQFAAVPKLIRELQNAQEYIASLLNTADDKEVHDILVNNGETVEDGIKAALAKAGV